MSDRGERLLKRLARRTSSTEYLAEVDGLRFIAIGLVLVFHAGLIARLGSVGGRVVQPFGIVVVPRGGEPLLERLVMHGSVGVYIFFMISGFVLALPFVRSRVSGTNRQASLSRYYVRRVTRIEPPYLLCLVLLFLAVWFAGGGAYSRDLVAGLAYVHQPLFDAPNPLNSVMWSLEVEVQWYLVVPLAAILFTRGSALQRRLIILLVAVLALVAGSLDPSAVVRGKVMLIDNLQYFLVGWFVADLYVTDWRDRPEVDRRWDAVAFGAWVGLFTALVFAAPWWRLTVPVFGGLALAASFRGTVTRRALRYPWTATIGGMCYSIYLLHFPLFVLARKFVAEPGTVPYAVRLGWALSVLVPLGILGGAVYFVAIEKPCMDPLWPQRLYRRVRELSPPRRIVALEEGTSTVVVIPDSELVVPVDSDERIRSPGEASAPFAG